MQLSRAAFAMVERKFPLVVSAFEASIAAGYAIGFAYKKMYSQNSTYGTRYGWRGD